MKYTTEPSEKRGSVKEAFTVRSEQDGVILHGLVVRPAAGAPVAVLQISHGMIEHKERYLPFMRWMAARGYACVIHDHRGHGESVASPDDLGYFGENGGEALVKDLFQVTLWAKERFGALPFFLLGHSMGSLAARVYAQRYGLGLNALIVCGSPSKRVGIAAAEKALERAIDEKGGRWRSARLDNVFNAAFERRFRGENLPYSWICADRSVVEAHNADPLCTFTFTLNGYQSLLWLMNAAYDMPRGSAAAPELPVRFLSGADDVCLINRRRFLAAAERMRDAGYRSVACRLFQGMRHELLLEADARRVYADILRFLEPLADRRLADG